uniref:Retroviral polymerase SH3-like domain-containing protein n=1 Tax=Phytophthora ramorum TaxID=164328 RepID=H3GH08_PHYRM
MKVQMHFGKKFKFVQHDGARELATYSLKVFYEDEGIKQQSTIPCQTYIMTLKEKRCKRDPKARARLFLTNEDVSMAYRLYDIEARLMVVSRDVNFGEATIGLSADPSDENVNDSALELDALDLDDNEQRQTSFKLTGKRKHRPKLASKKQVLQTYPPRTEPNPMKKKSLETKMKMKTRHLQCFGVPVVSQ